MFQKIRNRLLFSYSIVFASILLTFAIAVRIAFARSLTRQLTDKLMVLGQGAAASTEFYNGQLTIESDFFIPNLIARDRALQWFDLEGRLVATRGKQFLTLPFSVRETVQIQNGKNRFIAVSLPIVDNDDRQLVGYIRVSQSLEEFDETLNKLDWGLAGGVFCALVLSGIGGVWLTRQAMQPIEESFQRLKQFTADASHELRSPLMAIKTNSAVALKYSDGMRDTDAEKFRAIASATNQMTRLTEDLLFLARTDRLPHRNWEAVNLTAILENLIQLYQPQAEAKQINLKTQLMDNSFVFGDAIQLRRLLANLIDNALHYTQAGGRVEIASQQVSSYLEIDVRDTGVGIASENLDKVFEQFWRADSSRSYWNGGSGLGLAIACAIAQHHGGLINLSSQIGKGSCFTVRLPVDPLSSAMLNPAQRL